jgi:hypothetical protein
MSQGLTARPRISRENPGLVLFLIDQSKSMGQPFLGSEYSKAEAVALTVNKAIDNLILNCTFGDLEDYYHVGAIGYGGTEVRIAFGGALAGLTPVRIKEVADNPLRVDVVAREINGKVRKDRQRVWITPVFDGKTPMTAALEVAARVADDWTVDFKRSIPPIVLNISDGKATDGDPRPVAERIRETGTDFGQSMLFNLQLTQQPAAPIEYPSDAAKIADPLARALRGMSSPLPPYMVSMGRSLGIEIADGARGFVYNGNMVNLVHFLQIGTTVV